MGTRLNQLGNLVSLPLVGIHPTLRIKTFLITRTYSPLLTFISNIVVNCSCDLLQESEQPSTEEAQNTTFMGRVRAYRSKQRRGSKVGDSFEEGGPLQKGMNGGGRPLDGTHQQRESRSGSGTDGTEGMAEFFAGVSEAKASFLHIFLPW